MTTQAQHSWLAELGIQGDQSGAYNGSWMECGGEWLETRSPATGEVIGRVKMATKADYDQVVEAAQAAFQRWRSVPGPQRGEIVRKMGNAIR